MRARSEWTSSRGLSPALLLGVVAAVFLASLLPARAAAEVFSSARTVPTRTIMLGLEPQVTPPSGPFYELFLHGGFGMTRGTDLQMKLGLPLRPGGPLYVGGEVQFALLHDGDGAPGISLSVGGHGHGWQRFGLDSTLILSNDFGKLEPLLAVDADFEFIGNSIDPIVHVVPGLMVDVSKVTRFNVELGVGVTSGAPLYVSAGFQFEI